MTADVLSPPRLSRLAVPERASLPAEVEALWADAEKTYGYVPNWLSTLSANPATIKRLLDFYKTLWDPRKGGLTIQEREIIAVVVSHENGCGYCVANHRVGLAKALGDRERAHRLADDHHLVDLSPRERALVDLSVKLTRTPTEVTDADLGTLREHGLSDEQILEVIEVAAFFNYTNRLTTAIATRPDDQFFA
ncbi:peroxidase-related enzyme [Actinomadura nitritigenes]|uniref:peroxidase-related enzyme n=1 Tax=Actinomadura nitritigenes TaxID=134602 RepID=UPI003D8CDD98